MAEGASEQAAVLEQTSAASEQITCMTNRNADHSRDAAAEMEEVNRLVANGNAALAEMTASMSDIRASSDKIGKIMRMIDEIAFQTNILALNANVEAARAGDAGSGFAVVADEVRNLAQRSAQAARDTAPLIEDSIAKSRAGNSKLEQMASVIHAITESAARVKTLVDEVNHGSQEQAKGIEQVSKAVQQIDEVTQRNAASSEESAAASTEVAAQAESMDNIARQLRAVIERTAVS
jgi:methyl-accepting chemotaxis protein